MKLFLITFAAIFQYTYGASIYGGNSEVENTGVYNENYGDRTSDVSGSDDQGGDISQAISGSPGDDYPVYHSIPETGFNCRNFQYPGYYADQETRCQVFHICQADGTQDSFLCPNGTLFNQEHFICDWWYSVDCAQASNYYSRNSELYSYAPGDISAYSGPSAYGGSSGSGSDYGASAMPVFSSTMRPFDGSTSNNYNAPILDNESVSSEDSSKVKY